MRYAQGGRLTDAERGKREQLRLQAVERFETRHKNAEVAAAPRVSVRSVERWRRAWREQGEAGLLSKGSPGWSKLGETQVARLEQELERGPLAHGWADQRETGDPRLHLRPVRRDGMTYVPLTRRPGGMHAHILVISPTADEPELRTHEGYE